MNNFTPRYGRPPHCPCCKVYSRADQREIMNYILEKKEAEIEYFSAEQAMDRIGISQSTLLRCQHRGEITVAKFIERKKYFRDRDVERLRREYRGRE